LRVTAGAAGCEHLQVEELPCEQRKSGQLSAAEQQTSARELPVNIKMRFAGLRHRSNVSWDEQAQLDSHRALWWVNSTRPALHSRAFEQRRYVAGLRSAGITNKLAWEFRALRFRASKSVATGERESDGI
jgi:hypothetical protein